MNTNKDGYVFLKHTELDNYTTTFPYLPPQTTIKPISFNGLFAVMSDKNEITPVYHIKQNRNGYPMFLIYDKNQWRYVSAKHFRPIE